MKKVFTLFTAVAVGLSSMAQAQLQNAGLENWNANVPASWGTIDGILTQFAGGNPGLVTKETLAANIAQGNASMKVKTDSITIALLGQTVLIPGVAVYGTLGFNLAAQTANVTGQTYIDRPDSFQFQYKYIPGAGGADTGLVALRLTKWDNATKYRYEVGNAFLNILSSPNFSTAKLDITYTSAMQPDTIQIFAVSSSPGTASGFGGAGGGGIGGLGGGVGRKGTNLFVDDIQLIGLDSTFAAYVTPNDSQLVCIPDSVTLRTDNIPSNTLQWYNGTTPQPGATGYVFKAAASGAYYVKATRQSVDYYSDTVIVTANAKPTVTYAGVLPDSICRNAAQLALSGGSPAGGAFSGPGVVQGNFNPNVAGNGVKTITYTYTNQATGCRNSATDSLVVKVCANGIELLQSEVELNVFPNPASSLLFFEGNSKTAGAIIFVYDLNGALVATEKMNNEKATLDVKALATGAYLFRLVDAKNNGLATGQISVAH